MFFLACNNPKVDNVINKAVYIKSENGKYSFYRNGQPFLVKGASGFTNLKRLKEAGGNTIRIWDTLHLSEILDSAQANNLAVIVGLPLPSNLNMELFYNNSSKVNANFKSTTALINKFKNHPAVLAWCLGNELPFPYRPQFNRFYTVFNNLVDMIHRDDPGHPVTTTIMNFQKKNISNVKFRTRIDFISFNTFGSINSLNNDLEKFEWLWEGPFLITEWGIEGPWVADAQNAWGAYVENTSIKKSQQYLEIYQRYMPVKNPRFLGSMVFYWGQKQEFTPTWFSLFDKNGNQTETVNVMQYIWTGKQPATHSPAVKFMLLNDKGDRDNILFKPNTVTYAKVYMDKIDSGLSYKWQLFPEDWYKQNGIFNSKALVEIKNSIIEDKGNEVKVKVPAKEGPYRLLVYIYNKHGYYSTSNVPFYVVNNP